MKTQTNKLIISALITAVVTGVAGCTILPGAKTLDNSMLPTFSEAPVQVSYLYEVQAPAGTVSDISISDAKNETFTLTLDALTGAADVVTRFADRPYREASTLTPDELTEQWSTLFASSSPNAILSYLEPGSALPQSIVVTLTKPVHDHNTGSLSFTATRIYRESSVEAKPRPATPTIFNSATLTVDSSTAISLQTEIPGVVIDISANSNTVYISCGNDSKAYPNVSNEWATLITCNTSEQYLDFQFNQRVNDEGYYQLVFMGVLNGPEVQDQTFEILVGTATQYGVLAGS